MRRWFLGAAGLAALVAGAALADDADKKLDKAPEWLKRPTANDIFSVYPVEALRRGRDGEARISCFVTVHGALNRCKVISESPAGQNFGEAALLLSSQFLFSPAIQDGKAVESPVNIPIRFKADRSPEASAPWAVLQRPRWSHAPSYEDFAAVYPAKARDKDLLGHVLLECVFKTDGTLGSCYTGKEQPVGFGFAEAARSLRPLFRIEPTLSDGRSVRNLHVVIPFNFTPKILSAETPVVGRPTWISSPTADVIDRLAPKGPSPSGATFARVMSRCRVAAGGRLQGCALEQETPLNEGYGQAALAMIPEFRVSLWTDEGLPTVGGTVRVPMRFDIVAPTKP
jgi:TonB family protein